MTNLQEDIRTSAEGRTLTLIRSLAATLRDLGWSVREAAEHSAGIVDVAATRATVRKGLETRTHLVALAHLGPRIIFSSVPRTTDDPVAGYAFAADDLQQRRALAEVVDGAAIAMPEHRPVVAPRARIHAGTFRSEDPAFADRVDDAFLAVEAIPRDRFAFDLDVLTDDLDAGGTAAELLPPLTRTRDLVHAIVVTDASLLVLGDRITRADWLRVHRTRVTEAGGAWIDVVRDEAFAKYAAAVTKHYR